MPIKVTFTYPGKASTVLLTGTFDKWQKSIKMTPIKNSVGFTAVVSLNYDSRYEYKFVVDGAWAFDHNSEICLDSHGNVNNVLMTDEEDDAKASFWIQPFFKINNTSPKRDSVLPSVPLPSVPAKAPATTTTTIPSPAETNSIEKKTVSATKLPTPIGLNKRKTMLMKVKNIFGKESATAA